MSPNPPDRPQTSVGGCGGGARLLLCAGRSSTCSCKVPASENPVPENLPTPARPGSRRRQSMPTELRGKNVTKQRKANDSAAPCLGAAPGHPIKGSPVLWPLAGFSQRGTRQETRARGERSGGPRLARSLCRWPLPCRSGFCPRHPSSHSALSPCPRYRGAVTVLGPALPPGETPYPVPLVISPPGSTLFGVPCPL